MIEKLPQSNTEAQRKLDRGRNCNMKEGLDARYDMCGGDTTKMERLDDPEYTSMCRIEDLFS